MELWGWPSGPTPLPTEVVRIPVRVCGPGWFNQKHVYEKDSNRAVEKIAQKKERTAKSEYK